MSTVYALAGATQVGTYPTEPDLLSALLRAYSAVELGVTVTIFAQDDDGSAPTALCTISPPVTPTTSTSPKEVTA